MFESITGLIKIVLILAGIGIAIFVGVHALIIFFYLFIYLASFLIVLLGFYLFTKGGTIGTFGLAILIFGIYLSIHSYFKCEKCGFGFKMLWFGKSLGRTTRPQRYGVTNECGVSYDKYTHFDVDCEIGTKCLKCGKTNCW